MSTAIQRRRGTTTEHNSFTGLAGELSIDTTKNTVVVHDGSTAGGIPLAKESMGDNEKITFGASEDLKIIHDGSNGYISNSTGNLYIRDTDYNGDIYIQPKPNENAIACFNDSSVNLYYDNAPKLATTTSGIDVTGSVTADSATGLTATFNSTANKPYIAFEHSGTPKFYIGYSGSVGSGSNFYDLYTTSANGLRFFTNASERMVITSTGNVTMGGNLDVDGDVKFSGSSTVRNTVVNNVAIDSGPSVPNPYEGFGFGIDFQGKDYSNAVRGYAQISTIMEAKSSAWTANAGDAGFKAGLSFSTNSGGAVGTLSNEKLRISGDGNVGIGTSSPEKRIHIYDSTQANQTLRFGNPSVVPLADINYSSHGSEYLTISCKGTTGGYGNIQFKTGATPDTRMVISSTGNVGIGVNSANAVLHTAKSGTGTIPTNEAISVANSSTNNSIIGHVNSNNNATYSGISLDTRVSGASRWLIANEWQSQYKGDLVFRGRDGGYTSKEVMRITSTGNVLLGGVSDVVASANAPHKLHIPDGLTFGGSAYTYASLHGSGGNVVLRANAYPANTGSESTITFKTSTSTGGTANDVVIKRGNMGLGVVPESWNSSHTALDVGITGALMAHGSANAFYTMCNAYLSESSGWLYKYTDTTGASLLSLKQGGFIFDVAPSGTAGNAISWTTRLKIDNTADGNRYYADYHYFKNVSGGYGPTYASSFNVTSDYRLKENVVPMSGSMDRLKALKPCRFNFKDADDTPYSSSITVDGFLAHEAQAIVPECVTGEKDAMKMEEYEVTPAVMDGETVVTEAVMGEREVPDYQGIDQAKLVPLLVGAIQELTARLETLENK